MITRYAAVRPVYVAYCADCNEGTGPHDDEDVAQKWTDEHNREYHMPKRFYLANCYPRINDETSQEYELRLVGLAAANNFSPRCAVNLHGDCGWCEASCRCLCHEPPPADEIVTEVVALLRDISDDVRVNDYQLTVAAEEIIEKVRNQK